MKKTTCCNSQHKFTPLYADASIYMIHQNLQQIYLDTLIRLIIGPKRDTCYHLSSMIPIQQTRYPSSTNKKDECYRAYNYSYMDVATTRLTNVRYMVGVRLEGNKHSLNEAGETYLEWVWDLYTWFGHGWIHSLSEVARDAYIRKWWKVYIV